MYVFDTSPISALFRNYYREAFPSLWESFGGLVAQERVVSVAEVFRELESFNNENCLKWIRENKKLFMPPSNEETAFIAELTAKFLVLTDRMWVDNVNLADPFVIAKAKTLGCCVVSAEKRKPNSAKIPTICDMYNIQCIDLEQFMRVENWRF